MAWVALRAAAEEERLKKVNIARRRIERSLARPMLLPDTDFVGRFRLTKSQFARLCEELIPLLPPNERVSGIRPDIKILAALHLYASGSYQRTVGDNDILHLSKQTVCECLLDVTDALNTPAILRKYGIKFPQSQADRLSVAMRFNERFGFPGVIGCIDGTHVAIIKPRDDEEAFYNRKNYHSLNVLVICDADLRILHVDASFGGASHDSHVWNMSPVNPVMRRLHDEGQNFWLLGDSGYAQRPWMMTPILNPEPNTPEAHYTYVHVRTRNVVERTFGVLKSRFRCLLAHRTMNYKPRKAARIVNACVVLHNFINDPNLEVDGELMRRDEALQPPPEHQGGVRLHDRHYRNFVTCSLLKCYQLMLYKNFVFFSTYVSYSLILSNL